MSKIDLDLNNSPEVHSIMEATELLNIPIERDAIDKVVRKYANLGKYDSLGLPNGEVDSKTPPGVKGLEMASTLMKILIGYKEHQTLPVFDEDASVIREEPRSMFFITQFHNKVDQTIEDKLATVQYRGFRLGLYMLGKAATNADYINTAIGSHPRIVAKSAESERSIVGQRMTSSTLPALMTGSYGPPMEGVNTNAFAVYDTEDAFKIITEYNGLQTN